MRITVRKRRNFDHIVGEEFSVVYGEYEMGMAKEEITRITEEYENELNVNGFELDDQDKMNDIEAATNLHEGEYDFDCGDLTYYISIEGSTQEWT